MLRCACWEWLTLVAFWTGVGGLQWCGAVGRVQEALRVSLAAAMQLRSRVRGSRSVSWLWLVWCACGVQASALGLCGSVRASFSVVGRS